MKTTILNLLAATLLIVTSLQIHAQGFVYDQQSATVPISPLGNGNADGLGIQPEPLTQSFVPSLSTIGFVQFEFADISGNGTSGATVYVNLWTGSPNVNSATFLGSTTPVYMPDGFVNNGLFVAGVANFYFSISIGITAGQTYYLQPVVQSGDNPWDIITIGNTYPNGQVFANGAGFNTDMWFREGVVSVPEPATLILIGLGILLGLFKRRLKLAIPLLLCASFLSVRAQDSVVQATAEESGLTKVSATILPNSGTFWVMTAGADGTLNAAPYPALLPGLSLLPVYPVTDQTFLVDATGGQISSSPMRMSRAQAASAVTAQSEAVAGLIGKIQADGNGAQANGGFQPNGLFSSFDTNGLWLENLNSDPTNLWLRLHNTIDGENYQLLSTTNLSSTNWDVGQLWGPADYTEEDADPILMTNAMRFFRIQHAMPIMALWNQQDSQEPTNSTSGATGEIRVYNETEYSWYAPSNDITVYYTIGGTAQSGIDYTNLSGSVTISASNYYAHIYYTPIYINPIAVGLKPDQIIVLKLLQNSNYLIDPDYLFATNILYANPEVVPTTRGDSKFPCPNTSLTFDLSLDANDPLNLPLTYTILTSPTHGTLTGTPPNITYNAPTNCYEGQDSFTFKVSDGYHDSAPATVTLTISSGLFANPTFVQVCRGAPGGFVLNSGVGCGGTPSYILLSNPAHGTVDTSSMPYLTYTSTNNNFTGSDSFNYRVTDACGYSVTGAVSIVIGDKGLSPTTQNVLTGTNQPVNITLSALDYNDSCTDDASNYNYTIVTSPAHGTLSGADASRIYTPNPNYEGVDTFQFTASDGTWTSTNAAMVTNFVVAGPVLMAGCDPFMTGTFAKLTWVLDTAVQQMQLEGLYLTDFIVYRSTNSGGPYTAIYTNADISQMSYADTNLLVGQTNYYVVTFQSYDGYTGKTYESPHSNELLATGHNPFNLLSANAIWDVTDVTSNRPPARLGNLPTPFSTEYPNQYANLLPLPNTYWPAAANGIDSAWSNNIVLVIPTNVILSQVEYSIAIDNDYWLYLNNSTNYIDMTHHEDTAAWAPFKSFESVAPGLLHPGTNNLGVVIRDRGGIDFFSMVVTTNTCGQ